jgi:hypothetical protein
MPHDATGIRRQKPDPQEVGYIIVIAEPGDVQGHLFIGWCPMQGTAALVERVRVHRSATLAVTDWFPSTRRIGHWHHKTLIASRVEPDNPDWYRPIPAVQRYLGQLRTQYDGSRTDPI